MTENPTSIQARRRRLFLIILVFTLFLLILMFYFSVFVPFLIGILIAYLLDPAVVYLERCRFHFKRTAATTVVFVLFLGFAFGLSILIYPVLARGVNQLTRTVSENEESIRKFVEGAFRWLEEFKLPFAINFDKQKLLAEITSGLQSFMQNFFRDLAQTVLSIVGSLPMLIVIPFIVFYFLKDKQKIFNGLKHYIDDEREVRIAAVYGDINSQLGGYIKGQVILSLLVFAITTVAMILFGINYAVLIGLASGVLLIIPYFGPILGAIPAVILAAINFQSSGHLIGVIIYFVVMNLLVATILAPRVFSSSTNLHPLVVLLAIYLGAAAFGMMGMIFAIPLAIVVKTLLSLVFNKYIKEI